MPLQLYSVPLTVGPPPSPRTSEGLLFLYYDSASVIVAGTYFPTTDQFGFTVCCQGTLVNWNDLVPQLTVAGATPLPFDATVSANIRRQLAGKTVMFSYAADAVLTTFPTQIIGSIAKLRMLETLPL